MLRRSTHQDTVSAKIRRARKSYVVEGEQLFYVDKPEDGSTFNHLVIRGREEAERVFMECHLTAGGHRGRDATIGKIKERYYGFLSRDQFSRDQLPQDQLSRDQLATRSTCHEINSNFFVFCFMGQEYHGANTSVLSMLKCL